MAQLLSLPSGISNTKLIQQQIAFFKRSRICPRYGGLARPHIFLTDQGWMVLAYYRTIDYAKAVAWCRQANIERKA